MDGISIDLEKSESVRVGVTRGETSHAIGPPRDHPDRADLAVEAVDAGVAISVDAMAGDHGTGHLDIELTVDEAAELAASLEATI